MKALAISEAPGIDNLRWIERPVPQPRRGEVVVRTRAVSLNYRDLEIVRGSFHARFQLPLVPLSDGAGEIVAIGEDVTRLKVGQRVASTFWQHWDAGGFEAADPERSLGGPLDGMLAEYVRLDASGVVAIPEHLSFEEAATLPCAGLTAWHALVVNGGLQAGETVLIQGTGGVAVFAVNFARMFGARAIVTSSSDEKLELARRLGASQTINYRRTADWQRVVLELTGGRGVDHVMEVGGAGTLSRSLQAVRVGGTIHLIGYLAGKEGSVNPMEIFRRKAIVRPASVGPRSSFEAMNRALALHGLHPAVGEVFSWRETAAAFRALESASHFGKIVLRVD